MRSFLVSYSDAANEDLRRAYRYIYTASTSSKTAQRYLNRVRRRCDNIGMAPYLGKDRSDLQPGIRSIPFEASAEIFYFVDSEAVRIARVFFNGQDYERALGGR